MRQAARRVLVVEDESSQQLMYGRALRLMEFEAVCVGSEEAARVALARGGFAIVILDLQLHGEPTLEFFEEIRDRHPEVSVVIATGHGTFDFARRSIQRDVVDFLAKPIPLGELEQALDRAWSRHVLVQTPVANLLPPVLPGSPGEDDDQVQEATMAFLAARKDLSLDAMERDLLMEALRRSDDNRKLAAELLGISERKLYYRLTQYRRS